MTGAEVIALLVALARAFGLVATDVVAWARGMHPSLNDVPLPPLDEVDAARDEALRRTGGA